MSTKAIKTAILDDKQRAIAVLVLAFITDPLVRWVHPDAQEYLSHFPEFINLFACKAFQHRAAYCVDGFSGAALWLPPDVQADEEPLVLFMRRTVPDDLQQDVFGLFEQMGNYHPDEPH